MRRLLGLVVLLVPVLGVVGRAPAVAQNACVSLGFATTGAPMFHPGFPPVTVVPTTTTFAFGTFIGGCVLPKALVNAAGVVTGWCGHSSGVGTTNNGDPFAFVTAGGVMVLTGGVVGVASVTPDIPGGQSCTSGATRFMLEAVYLKLPCHTQTPITTTVTIPSTVTTVVPTVSGGTMVYNTLVCVL